jgi:hypothetical protein
MRIAINPLPNMSTSWARGGSANNVPVPDYMSVTEGLVRGSPPWSRTTPFLMDVMWRSVVAMTITGKGRPSNE